MNADTQDRAAPRRDPDEPDDRRRARELHRRQRTYVLASLLAVRPSDEGSGPGRKASP